MRSSASSQQIPHSTVPSIRKGRVPLHMRKARTDLWAPSLSPFFLPSYSLPSHCSFPFFLFTSLNCLPLLCHLVAHSLFWHFLSAMPAPVTGCIRVYNRQYFEHCAKLTNFVQRPEHCQPHTSTCPKAQEYPPSTYRRHESMCKN